MLELTARLSELKLDGMFNSDFLLTADKTRDELEAVLTVAAALRELSDKNFSARIFDTGLAVSIIRDGAPFVGLGFDYACETLGMRVREYDPGKNGTGNAFEAGGILAAASDVIGIRDSMPGRGGNYMRRVSESVEKAWKQGVLKRRPAIINLGCDRDDPVRAISALTRIARHFGGLDKLKGRTVAVSWTYSPDGSGTLSAPQSVMGLLSRFGMEIALAHPEGYSLTPEIEKTASAAARESGGGFVKHGAMEDALKGADIVCPVSWPPVPAVSRMEELYAAGDFDGANYIEKGVLEENAKHTDWECTEERMSLTRGGQGICVGEPTVYVTGVNCERGGMSEAVFEKFKPELYAQADDKLCVIAAMIFASKVEKPSRLLAGINFRSMPRLRQDCSDIK